MNYQTSASMIMWNRYGRTNSIKKIVITHYYRLMLFLWFLLFLDLATGTTAFFCVEKRVKHTFLPFVVSLLSSFIVCPGNRMEESDLMKERLQAITVSFYYTVVIN